MLTERMAATLSSHEPGWRLPRRSELARRYNVTIAEINAAISQLAARHLLRCLPDGQVYRASPAEYLIRLAGARGVGTHIDPLGAPLTCTDLHVSLRRIPEDIAVALGVPPAAQATVIRCVWAAYSDHAALSTTYLPRVTAHPPEPAELGITSLDSVLNTAPALIDAAIPGPAGYPAAMALEMQLPAPSIARSLRLPPSQPAITVVVRFEDPSTRATIALTTAVLRADIFRIVIEGPTLAPGHQSTAGLLPRDHHLGE